MADNDAIYEEWTYIGKRIDPFQVNTTWHTWLNEAGEEMRYKRAASGLIVGGLYRVKLDKEGSLFYKAVEYLHAADVNHDDLATWRLLHRTADVKSTMARNAKKRSDEWKEALAPIAKAYHSTPPVSRAALLGLVINEITGYRSDR